MSEYCDECGKKLTVIRFEKKSSKNRLVVRFGCDRCLNNKNIAYNVKSKKRREGN